MIVNLVDYIINYMRINDIDMRNYCYISGFCYSLYLQKRITELEYHDLLMLAVKYYQVYMG